MTAILVVVVAVVVAILAFCVLDNIRMSRRFAEALAQLPCSVCGAVYGPEAAAGRRCAGITGPPAFMVRCSHCGVESVRLL